MARRRRDRQQGLAGAEPDGGRSQRQRRVGEELRHALAKILRDGECRDPLLREANITVAEVRMSPDLRNASVFVMPLGGAKAAETVAALERSAGFLRGLVARGVNLRRVPSLTFALDVAFDQADRIARLLASPEVGRDLDPQRMPSESADDAG